MKYIIAILILAFGLILIIAVFDHYYKNPQSPTVPYTGKEYGNDTGRHSHWGMAEKIYSMDAYGNSISMGMGKDSLITIEGDTIKGIRNLFSYILKEQERYNKPVVIITSNGDTLRYYAGDTVTLVNAYKNSLYASAILLTGNKSLIH